MYSLSNNTRLIVGSISSVVAIGLGYWIFNVEENEPFPDPPKNDNHGQRFYLKRLIKWADQLGLKVLLDIHAAPGSQNGFDNSGRMGPIGKIIN